MRCQRLLLIKSWCIAFLCVVAFYSSVASAHSTLFATYIMKKSDEGWHLSANFPLYSVHKVLLEQYTEQQLLKAGEYNQDIVIEYLLNNISVMANNKHTVKLTRQSIVLDNHQSQIKFVVNNMPDEVEQLSFKVTAMSKNPGHSNLVRVLLGEGKRNKKVVLHARNNFQGDISF